MITDTITHDSFTIETVRGSRRVTGEGTAIMVRNFELAKGGEVAVVPSRLHIDLIGVPTEPVVFLNDDPAPEPMFPFHLDRGLQQSLYGDPLSLDHDFELAEIEHTDPAVIEQIADGQALHDAVAAKVGHIGRPTTPADWGLEDATDDGISFEARRDELEALGSKPLRPIASALGIKGARIMQKGDMIKAILDAEFG